MLIETERLILKPLCENDFNDLKLILKNKEIMFNYNQIFTDEECKIWLDNQLNLYKKGYGLFGVFLKDNNKFIGQAGIMKHKLQIGNSIRSNPPIVDEIEILLEKEEYIIKDVEYSNKYKFIYEIIDLTKKEALKNVYIIECIEALKKYAFKTLNLEILYFIVKEDDTPSKELMLRPKKQIQKHLQKLFFKTNLAEITGFNKIIFNVYSIEKEQFLKNN